MQPSDSRSAHAVGPALLIFSNALLCAVLIVLRESADTSSGRVFVLALANLIASVSIFGQPAREERLPQRLSIEYLLLLAWSCSYCLSYGLFVVFAENLSITQLIICQSIAPALAAYFSGDLRREGSGGMRVVLQFFPLSILLLLSIVKWVPEVIGGTFLKTIALSFAVLIGLVASQTCARGLAQRRAVGWIQPRLTIANSILLCIGLAATNSLAYPSKSSTSVIAIFGAGALILGIQVTYLAGLRKAAPVLGALALSTSVPLSLFADALWYSRTLTTIEFVLGLGYCGSILLVARTRADRSTSVTTPQASRP